MEAPECPFCKKKEWGHICGAGLEQVKEKLPVKVGRANVQLLNAEAVQAMTGHQEGVPDQLQRQVKTQLPAPAKAKGRPKIYTDAVMRRKQYMKEYMRKRRAKAKVDHGKVQDV